MDYGARFPGFEFSLNHLEKVTILNLSTPQFLQLLSGDDNAKNSRGC